MNPFLLLLILTSCTTSVYEAPEADIDEVWPLEWCEEGLAASETEWQTFFQSPNLRLLIQTALENNRDLRIAALQVEAAEAGYRGRKSDLWPALDFSLGALRQKLPGHATRKSHGDIISDYSATIGTTAYELDLFKRLRSLSERELNLYLATSEAQMSVQIALIAEVAQSYFTYLADKKLLDLTYNTLKAQEEVLQVLQRSFDIGSASNLDLSQAVSAVESARVNQFEYERRLLQDKNALKQLIGTDVCLEGETLDELTVPQLQPGLPSELLLNRPDIREAEYALKAAHANLAAARAAFFPSIVLTGSFGYGSDKLLGLWPSGSGLTWTFIGGLTQPIFHAGSIRAGHDQALALQQIALAQYEKAIQTAFREVADELIASQTYADQWNAQQKLVSAYQQSYDLASERYQQGVASYLNVLDAQRALYQAQQSAILLQQQRLGSWVTLYKVLGGGQF